MLTFSLSSSIISPNFSISPNCFSPKNPNSPSTTDLRRLTTRAASAACVAAETAVSSSFYDVLGISAAASKDEIKAAYRRMARSCHPDVAGKRVDDAKSAADAFIRVRDAYSILSDPNKRADYDRKLFFARPMTAARFSRMSTSSSSSFRVPRKNWESDQCW
ncbi:hypothetical protein RND81_11G233700 [Saponaria officinalis]|uniref:J domain-containing protein n=1 Tax=Saponaria officinalis TaxID=3572 RepID=A0AAW1HRA2_SAPOF